VGLVESRLVSSQLEVEVPDTSIEVTSIEASVKSA